MVKKMIFDALEQEGEADSVELHLNGEIHQVYRPTSGQVAIMMAAFGEDASVADGAASILHFYRNIMEPEGYAAIKSILNNPRIPDSLERVMELTQDVIEEFTGNPTKQPTDYLQSQKSAGQNSTASRRAPASTRSRSLPAGSATGSTRSTSRS